MATSTGTRSNAQLFALIIGVVYLAVGVVGFFVTGFGNFAGEVGDKLIIFHINGLHNVVHILLGVVWIGASGSHSAAKGINTLFGAVLLLVFVLGLFDLKFLAIHNAGDPDNYLHLVTGLLSVYFGTAGAARAGATTTA